MICNFLYFSLFLKDDVTEYEISELSTLTFYSVASMTNWTRELDNCPNIEVADVKKFICDHTSVDMVNNEDYFFFFCSVILLIFTFSYVFSYVFTLMMLYLKIFNSCFNI